MHQDSRGHGCQYRGQLPFDDGQADFTQMPQAWGNGRYPRACIDIFSGWREAFPTQTEKAAEAVMALLREIIPRYGFP